MTHFPRSRMHIASSNGHFCGLKRTRSEASRRHLNCSWLVPYPNRLRCQECPAHRLFLTSQTVRVPSQAKQFMFVRSYRRVSADKRTSVRLSAQNASRTFSALIYAQCGSRKCHRHLPRNSRSRMKAF